MQRTPNALFVIDLKTEAIAVREAQRLRIPIIGLVDTNCDPDGIDYVIPGNDDAMRSCALIAKAIGDVVAQGHAVFRAEEEKARQERVEQARREAEERARREAEEQAKREAEEQVAKEAAEKQAAAAQAAAAAPAAEPAAEAPTEKAQEAPAAAQEAPAARESA
jgi:small subunit ribosomal protein S2